MGYTTIKPVDRRVKRTKKLLKDSLALLLIQKDIKDITVKEIVDMADINRGTFYLHYKDIYDMLSQIENDMIADLEAIADKFTDDALKETPKPYILAVFVYIKENQEFCRMLLGFHGDMAFVEKLKKVVERKCFSSVMSACPQNEVQSYEFFATYAVSGCIGLIQSWMERGMLISPEEMADIAESMVQKGVGSLLGKTGELFSTI